MLKMWQIEVIVWSKLIIHGLLKGKDFENIEKKTEMQKWNYILSWWHQISVNKIKIVLDCKTIKWSASGVAKILKVLISV